MSISRARALRRNPTDAEKKLWSVLRLQQMDGHRFRRQHPVGAYVVDFICLAEKLIIEVDGGQHASQTARDQARTEWLGSNGYRVLRYWNNDVLGNIDGVAETILAALRSGDSSV
jgi:very-short-patch-repair endonuclease